jgi:Bacterial PH domain/Short C-terminal domain
MAGPTHGPDEREGTGMSYADTLMSTGEDIRLRDRQHWFILVWAGRWAVLAIIIGLVLIPLGGGMDPNGVSGSVRSLVGFATAALLIGGIISFVWEALKYRNQEYVLTNRRVIQVGGVINKHSTDSSLEKINDAALSQSLFGRMFGFGDLDILTASEAGIERFRMIHDPIGFKKAMLDAKHEYEQDMARGPVPVSPPLRAAPPERMVATDPDATSTTAVPPPAAPPPAPAPAPVAAPPPPPAPEPRMSPDDVTRTLSSLADLRDRGAISPEEYEQKKADLLARI